METILLLGQHALALDYEQCKAPTVCSSKPKMKRKKRCNFREEITDP